MATQQEITERIEEIEAILRAGQTSITIDGVTTTYDFAELRRQRAELIREHTASKNSGKGRGRMVRYRF